MSSNSHYKIVEEIMRNSVSYPGLPVRKAIPLIRIWFYPTFQPRTSWSVIREKESLFIRRVVWNQNSESLSNSPITYGSEAPIEQALFNSLVSKLQKIEIPVYVPNNTIGLDGETRGIETGNYMISSSLSWWCEAPAEWAEIEAWFYQATKVFDSLLPEYSVN